MKKIAKILLAFVFCLALVSLTFAVTYTAMAQRIGRPSAAAQKAEEVYEYLDAYFIGDLDEDAIDDAIGAAMVSATGDRWSYYISAEDYGAHQDQLENAYVGVGMTVQLQEDGFYVTQVEQDGPAAQAGILPGDRIDSVDGASCGEMTMEELRRAVRGEAGTQVVIAMEREGQTLEFTITRQQLQTKVVDYTLLDSGVGYIQIYNFDGGCAENAIAAVEELTRQGAKALLFDVRNDPGGLKSELVELLDYLLPEGVLFRSVNYAGEEKTDYSDASCVSLPMAVLVNEDSYSAAEFFAAALREYGVAQVFGAQTCGKGYFQVALQLSDGSALNLSIGKYYTPNGVSLADAGGLVPDESVELTQEQKTALLAGTLEKQDDPQLQAAEHYLEKELESEQ